MALTRGFEGKAGPLPAEQEIRAPRGCLPPERAGVKHGWHSQDAVQVPTALTCNLCPLYHVKRKDRRQVACSLIGR